MPVLYDPVPSAEKERMKKEHPRGLEIIEAIERDLSFGNLDEWATLVKKPNRYAIVYTPEVSPPIEIRISFLLADGGKVLIKVFRVTAQL